MHLGTLVRHFNHESLHLLQFANFVTDEDIHEWNILPLFLNITVHESSSASYRTIAGACTTSHHFNVLLCRCKCQTVCILTWFRHYACNSVTPIPPQWFTTGCHGVHSHHSDVVGSVLLQSCQVVVGVSTHSVHCSKVDAICSILNLVLWSSIEFSWW